MRNTALFAVAAAFTLVAAALFQIGAQLPELNANLERMTRLGDTLSAEVPGVVDVANRYEPHIDPMLAEVAASRTLAEQALDEAAAYRAQLPAMLEQLDALDTRLGELQAQLPEVLTRVDGALDESRAWRPVSEQALGEAHAWRGSIPGYLDRSERLVASAREAGKEASAGMVSGFFSGALSLPFQALGNVGALVDPRSLSARHLTDEDQANLRNAAIALLQDPSQKVAQWSSSNSGHSGTVSVIDSSSNRKGTCHTLAIENRFRDDKSETLERQICQDQDGKWNVRK